MYICCAVAGPLQRRGLVQCHHLNTAGHVQQMALFHIQPGTVRPGTFNHSGPGEIWRLCVAMSS